MVIIFYSKYGLIAFSLKATDVACSALTSYDSNGVSQWRPIFFRNNVMLFFTIATFKWKNSHMSIYCDLIFQNERNWARVPLNCPPPLPLLSTFKISCHPSSSLLLIVVLSSLKKTWPEFVAQMKMFLKHSFCSLWRIHYGPVITAQVLPFRLLLQTGS